MGSTDAGLRPAQPAILDTVQEIAVYIHRFHNLDLFEQGRHLAYVEMMDIIKTRYQMILELIEED